MRLPSWAAGFVSVDLWEADLTAVPFVTRWKVYFFRFLVAATQEFLRDQITLRAMGLVYTSLLSLVPLLAVTFSVLKAFGVHQSLEPVLLNTLEPLGTQGVELTHHIITFVNNLEVGVLGAVGVAGLFFTVISLLGQIEDALNQIWGAQQARTLGRKFTDYLSVILVGPVLVFSALALTASAQSYWLVQWMLEQSALGWIVVALTRVTPFLFLCTAFTFFYKVLPCTQVRFSAALVGGATAGLLWQTVGIGFSAFIVDSARYTAIYSGFAVIILFLIWLYVGWLVILIGGEIAYLYQQGLVPLAHHSRRRRGGGDRLRLALRMFVAIASRMLTRQPPWTENALAAQIDASTTELKELIDTCVQHELLLRTAEPAGVGLARLPGHITVYDIYRLVEQPSCESTTVFTAKDEVVADVLRRYDQAIRKEFSNLTLRSLIADPSDASSVPQSSLVS